MMMRASPIKLAIKKPVRGNDDEVDRRRVDLSVRPHPPTASADGAAPMTGVGGG